jgi:hypothetical protein
MADAKKTTLNGEIMSRMRETIVSAVDEFAKTRVKVNTKLFEDIDWQISLSQSPMTKDDEDSLLPNECVFFFRMAENGSTNPRILIIALALTASHVKECPIFNRIWEGFPSKWVGSPTANSTSGDGSDIRGIETHLLLCLDDAVVPLAESSDEEDLQELNRAYGDC